MNKYFKIAPSNDKDRIEIECGKNGRVFLIRTDMGMVIDVYANGEDELIDTMALWDEDLHNETDWTDDLSEDEQHNPITTDEILAFKGSWGQTHKEICENLEYDEATSDDLLMEDYFWLAEDDRWYPIISNMYTEREQEIADYLYNDRMNVV